MSDDSSFWSWNNPLLWILVGRIITKLEAKAKIFWKKNQPVIQKNWKTFDDITVYSAMCATGAFMSVLFSLFLVQLAPKIFSWELTGMDSMPFEIQLLLLGVALVIAIGMVWFGVNLTDLSGKKLHVLVKKLDFTPS